MAAVRPIGSILDHAAKYGRQYYQTRSIRKLNELADSQTLTIHWTITDLGDYRSHHYHHYHHYHHHHHHHQLLIITIIIIINRYHYHYHHHYRYVIPV
jgi:hypothetical protein